MKKLLTAILAFSCAFGAWAEEVSRLSGTDFSTYPVGVFSTETDDSGITESAQRFWFSGNKEDFDGEVVNVSSNEETGATVNYLEFESNITNPVYRTVNNSVGAVAPDATSGDNANQGFIAKKIGTGIFIDTYVQFTPYLVNENHPAPEPLTNKDKIIVWVKETESLIEGEPNTTNLVVTAGKIGAGATVSPEQYVINCDADALCKGQHRLTIKAFEDISANSALEIAGFVVYIDGEEVSYLDNQQEAFAIDVSLDTTPGLYYTNEKKSLFPSLMGNTALGVDGGDEISAVGFAGMGQIGEVWFDDYSTAYPAFASDDINFTITVGNGVTSYTYNGQTYNETKTFAVKPGTASIKVTGVTYDTTNGWVAKASTWFAGTTQVNNAGSADGDSGTFSFANGTQFTLAGFKANFRVGDEEYETFLGNVSEEGGALQAAIDSGAPLKLISDVDIEEMIIVEDGETLTIDLNGHTIMVRGIYLSTIENYGTLTINDTTGGGKVLGVINPEEGYVPVSISNGGTLNINAGMYEYIATMEGAEEFATIAINGGEFMNPIADDDEDGITDKPTADDFYFIDSVAEGLTVTVSESTKVIATGDAFAGLKISPAYYTTVADPAGDDDEVVSYTITYDSEHGTLPVAVTVTVTNDTSYALTENELPTLTEDGFTFGGWSLTEGGEAVKVGDTISANTTLYALWTEDVDPWEPEEDTDDSAKDKVADIFGEDSPAATNITTYVDYTNLVEYIKTAQKTNPGSTPNSLTAAEKTYIIESLKLGAAELFTAKPKIELKDALPSTEDDAEAGDWKFNVKVTQGSAVDALEVAVEKVKALVKICSDLKNGQWAAPQAANIDAAQVTGGNEITITIKFGDAKSGFMMIRE